LVQSQPHADGTARIILIPIVATEFDFSAEKRRISRSITLVVRSAEGTSKSTPI